MTDKIGSPRPTGVTLDPARPAATPAPTAPTAAPRPASAVGDALVQAAPVRKAPVALGTPSAPKALDASPASAGNLFREQITRTSALNRVRTTPGNAAQARELFSFLKPAPDTGSQVGAKGDAGTKGGKGDVGTKGDVGGTGDTGSTGNAHTTGDVGTKGDPIDGKIDWNKDGPTPAATRKLLDAQPGFKALPANQQFAFQKLTTGAEGEYLRRYVQALTSDPGFTQKSAADQTAAFHDLLLAKITPDERALTSEPKATQVKIGAPRTQGDQDVFEVTVRGKTIPISMPHQDPPSATSNGKAFGDRTNHTVATMAKALSELQPETLAVVNTVNLSATPNPEDAFWAEQYHMPGFTSYMTCGASGDVNVYPMTDGEQPKEDIAETLMHESGHAWSKGRWGEDTSGPGWKPWRDAAAKDGIPVSGYAESSMDEDVAETMALYLASRGTPQFDEFRQMYPARFAVLDRELGVKAVA